MGPIQSSLNQLSLGILGTAAGFTKGLKSAVKKPDIKSPSTETQPQTEVSSGMGNIAKIGRVAGYRRYMAGAAALSGNDMIAQKARASFKPLEERKKALAASADFTGGGE